MSENEIVDLEGLIEDAIKRIKTFPKIEFEYPWVVFELSSLAPDVDNDEQSDALIRAFAHIQDLQVRYIDSAVGAEIVERVVPTEEWVRERFPQIDSAAAACDMEFVFWSFLSYSWSEYDQPGEPPHSHALKMAQFDPASTREPRS